MCLILFAHGAHPRYPLIVAANRDESFARPSEPADAWSDAPHVFGGRDLEAGGTWLAVSTVGRFAAVTNYRQGAGSKTALRSRGDLTRQFLVSDTATSDYVAEVAGRSTQYNGFSLLVGRPDDLWFLSNRGGGARRVSRGVHGLSNHLLDEPWPKVHMGISRLKDLLSASEETLAETLLMHMSDSRPAPDALLPSTGIPIERERAHSSAFIMGENYGTRATTLVLVAVTGKTLFIERRYGPGGTLLGETRERLALPAIRQGDSSEVSSFSSMER